MIPVATRPLPIVAALLALATLPVWSSHLTARTWESCSNPAALEDTAAIPGSVAEPPAPLGAGHTFLRRSGKLREPSAAGGDLLYWLVRSRSAFQVYSQPTYSLNLPLDPDETDIRWREVDGERVPIHVASSTFGNFIHVAAYVMEYGGRPVEQLLPVQIETALAQLRHGTRPISLYIVDGIARSGRPEEVSGPATDWLVAAWRRHRAACGP